MKNVAVPSSSPLQPSVPPSVPPVTSAAADAVSALTSSAVEAAASRRSLLSRWPLLLSGVLVAAVVVAFGMASGAYSRWAEGDSMAPGITVAGVAVGGLTRSQAQQNLETRFGHLFVTLQTDKRPFKVSLRELGGQPAIAAVVQKAARIGRDGSAIDNFLRVYGSKTVGQSFMLPVMWRKAALIAKLKTIDHLYAVPARDARLEVVGGEVRVLPDASGKSLNLGETALRIQKKYFIGVPELTAATQTVLAQTQARDLAGRDVLLASYPTRFNPGLAGRTTNIRVACSAIEGKVLMPGETFSFNGMTGERTWHKGYRMAHIFERKPGETESEVVDGLAGGVCQVSSTLYNALLRANRAAGKRSLKIVERNTHSLPVTYVPSGMDATVAWPYKDLRFRNTFDHPVYLRTSMGRSKLIIGIWGRVPEGSEASEAAPLEIATLETATLETATLEAAR